MRSITLPPVLAYKVRKIAAEKKTSLSEALIFLVNRVCTPRLFLPVKVCTPRIGATKAEKGRVAK